MVMDGMTAEIDPTISPQPWIKDEGESTGQPASPIGVLIIQGNTIHSSDLASELQRLGKTIIGQASTAQEALDLYLKHKPKAVVMDARVTGDDGIDLAAKLNAIRRCAVVVVTSESDAAQVDRAAKAGVFAYLIAPAPPESIAAAITISLARFADHDRVLRENQQLGQSLENRKLIERAKGIYMKHLGLGEPEAHRRLQQESQKRRLPLVELARKIIESEDLLGGGGA
jgi:AmiR/NasT family two-component response regulator